MLAVDSSAMFVLIGLVPHTAWLDGQIPLDEKGLATEDVSEQPLRYRRSYSPPGELVDVVGGTGLHTLLTPTLRAPTCC